MLLTKAKEIILIRFTSKDKIHASVAPMGLGYLATTLKREGFSVEIIDFEMIKGGWKKGVSYICKRISETRELVAVGVQLYLDSSKRFGEFCKTLKAVMPKGVPLIVGGIAPTTFPEETLARYPEVDFAFAGEADLTFSTFLKALAEGRFIEDTKGLVFRKNGRVFVNPPHFPEDLDAIGFPDWEALKIDSYRGETFGGLFMKKPCFCLISSRGCPFNCAYCSVALYTGHKHRRHSFDNFISQLESLQDRYNLKEVKIIDDCFITSVDSGLEFCEKVKRSKLKTLFSFPMGIEARFLEVELVKALKEINTYAITIAVESAVPRIRKLMNRPSSLELIKERIALLKKYNFFVRGFFIVGYPGETESEVKENLKFALSQPFNRISLNAFIPLPKTRIYEQLEIEGKLPDLSWEDYQMESVKYSFCELPVNKLRRLRSISLIKFYLRPKILFNLLSYLFRCPVVFKYVVEKALEYMFRR